LDRWYPSKVSKEVVRQPHDYPRQFCVGNSIIAPLYFADASLLYLLIPGFPRIHGTAWR
jgi:hypothetical protein